MDKNSNAYVVFFAATMCIVLATALAATFHGLKSRIDSNTLFDKQRNVLIACGLYDPSTGEKSRAELEAMFTKVKPVVLEFFESEVDQVHRERGEKKTRKVKKITSAKETAIKLEELAAVERDHPERILSEIYIAEDQGKRIYCIPISGYGLWSWLYGFLALEADRNTVRGITFYKHGETPGLGGEVDKRWWQDNWKGKTTHDESGKLVSITVLKGKGHHFAKHGHEVDGISGATITSKGVMKFVRADLEKYEVYFKGTN